MTSDTDSISRHIHVDSRRASSAESLIDHGSGSSGGGGGGGGGSSICGPGRDGDSASEARTDARRDDDSDLESPCRRQAQNEFLYAMKEDLGDWLGALYGVDIGADEFFEKLETGVLLCRHANAVHDRLRRRTKDGDRGDYHRHLF